MVILACCRRARPAAYHPARAAVTEPSTPTRIDAAPSVLRSTGASSMGGMSAAQKPTSQNHDVPPRSAYGPVIGGKIGGPAGGPPPAASARPRPPPRPPPPAPAPPAPAP